MHVLIGIGLLAAIIAFAFGEVAARLFVAAVLVLGAAGALFVMYMIATRVLT